MSRTALVLGAGLGGLVAAESLRKLLPKTDRVIAVDRAADHFFPPSLLWLMVGERAPADFSRPLARLAGRGVEFHQGSVTRINPAARQVEIGGQAISADIAHAWTGKGNFYAEPTPQVEVRGPSLMWHAGKILYEKYWLYRRF